VLDLQLTCAQNLSHSARACLRRSVCRGRLPQGERRHRSPFSNSAAVFLSRQWDLWSLTSNSPVARGITGFPMRDVAGDELRKYGRAGARQRKRRLRREPLCRHCAAQGYVSASTVVDHIVPLSRGGTDDDSNTQCLCTECHDAKTRKDFGFKAGRPRQNLDADGWPID
jgi:5-methylcytosine-specific restriction enzyme A